MIKSYIDSAHKNNPNKIALFNVDGDCITFKELIAGIEKVHQQFIQNDIKPNARIGLVMHSGLKASALILGILTYSTLIPINPDINEVEFSNLIDRLDIDILILDEESRLVPTSKKIESAKVILVKNDNNYFSIFSNNLSVINTDQYKPNYPPIYSLILETSGTTAKPKQIGLNANNLLASCKNIIYSLELTENDNCVHFLPNYHIGGIVDVLLAPIISGGSVICLPQFTSDFFYKSLERFEPTWFQAAPALLFEIEATFSKYQAQIHQSKLRFIRSVSAPLPKDLHLKIEQQFQVPVVEIYGMSEASGVVTSNPPNYNRKISSVGKKIQTDIKLLNHNNEECLANMIGEIYIKGSNVITDYLSQEKDLFKDGWLSTGDLGFYDEDGFLFLSGRIKDLINRGGEKISPIEIEHSLIGTFGIREATCFPVAHPTLNEEIACALVMENALVPPQLDELKSHLMRTLSHFKVPSIYIFTNEIPKNNTGKIQRHLLSKHFINQINELQKYTFDNIQATTGTQQALVALWEKTLDIRPVGITDDFFKIGGNSLKAANLISEIQSLYGETIYVSSIFEYPTIQHFSTYLEKFYPKIIEKIIGQKIFRDENIKPISSQDINNLRKKIWVSKNVPSISKSKNSSAIFILSPPRSGSTLLRAMLAGNPSLFSPPELYLLQFANLQERAKFFSGAHKSQLEGNIRCLMSAMELPAIEAQALMLNYEKDNLTAQEYYFELQNLISNRTLVDKTPANSVDIDTLNRAEDYFENPKYIHLQRHPYGMIKSFEEAHLDQLWYPRLLGKESSEIGEYPYSKRQLAELIWTILQKNILSFLDSVPPNRQFVIKFEDLVTNPEKQMKDLSEWLNIPFSIEMLKPQEPSAQRMVDGIYSHSRMIGDPKFHSHQGITASAAHSWHHVFDQDFLCAETWEVAKSLGYEDSISTHNKRDIYEF